VTARSLPVGDLGPDEGFWKPQHDVLLSLVEVSRTTMDL